MADVQPTFDRIKRQLGEAEGYLMLDMPARALEILGSRTDWATMQFEAGYLTGEALRALGRFRDALRPLEVAAALRPADVATAIALGWCYKRTHRLAQAIDALDRALRHIPKAALPLHHREVALLHYNLSCYWSLAGNPSKSLDELAAALDLDPEVRARIADEPDFDPIRGTPEFDRLTLGPAPLA